MSGWTDGFNSDPARCEKMRHIWRPELVAQWKEMRRLSVNRGGAGSLIQLGLSAGGHLPICIENIKLAEEYFPDALKGGVFFYLRGAWVRRQSAVHGGDRLRTAPEGHLRGSRASWQRLFRGEKRGARGSRGRSTAS